MEHPKVLERLCDGKGASRLGKLIKERLSPHKLPEGWPHLRDLPLSTLVAMLGGWVLVWLLQVTDNPLSQLLHMDPETFLLEARALDYLIYVGGHLLLLALCVGLLVLGLGRRGARELCRRPRSCVAWAPAHAWWRLALTPGGLAAGCFFAMLAAFAFGQVTAYALPSRYVLEMPYALEDYQFDSASVALAVAAVRLARVAMWQLWLLVPLSLVMRSGVVDLHNARHVMAVTVALFVGGGLAFALPAEGTLVFGVFLYGWAAVASGVFYLLTRSYPVCVLASWTALQVLTFLMSAIA